MVSWLFACLCKRENGLQIDVRRLRRVEEDGHTSVGFCCRPPDDDAALAAYCQRLKLSGEKGSHDVDDHDHLFFFTHCEDGAAAIATKHVNPKQNKSKLTRRVNNETHPSSLRARALQTLTQSHKTLNPRRTPGGRSISPKTPRVRASVALKKSSKSASIWEQRTHLQESQNTRSIAQDCSRLQYEICIPACKAGRAWRRWLLSRRRRRRVGCFAMLPVASPAGCRKGWGLSWPEGSAVAGKQQRCCSNRSTGPRLWRVIPTWRWLDSISWAVAAAEERDKRMWWKPGRRQQQEEEQNQQGKEKQQTRGQ